MGAQYIASGEMSDDQWREILSPYRSIILVANSDAAKDALKGSKAPGALYIFFNEVFRVLDGPFREPAMLVVRSNQKGPVLRRKGGAQYVLDYFPEPSFLGVVNLRGAAPEKPGEFDAKPDCPVRLLDLVGYFDDFYPASHFPSSGFAMLVWLVELGLPAEIILAGFSAKRSERWRVHPVHDWTLEQITIEALVRAGKARRADDAPARSFAAIAKRFPGIAGSDVGDAVTEVLSRRLDNANDTIDRLYSVTKPLRAVDGWLRNLKAKRRS